MDETPRYASDKRKQSLYFPRDMLDDIRAEAVRLDRSLSWIVQRAWMMSRADIAAQPGIDPITGKRTPALAPSETKLEF